MVFYSQVKKASFGKYYSHIYYIIMLIKAVFSCSFFYFFVMTILIVVNEDCAGYIFTVLAINQYNLN